MGKFLARLIKNIGIIVLVLGTFISVMRGVDKLDFFMAGEGAVISVVIGVALIGLSHMFSVKRIEQAMENPSDEYTEAFYNELLQKKKKAVRVSFIISGVGIVVFAVYLLVAFIAAPYQIEGIIEDGKYEEAFDAVIKAKMTAGKKAEYKELIMPKMIERYEKEKENRVVLEIDDIKIIRDDSKLYMEKDGVREFIYEAGSYDITATGYFDNDFIYSGGQVLFIEHLAGDSGRYKNVVAVDLKTKNHQLVDYKTECYYLDKLTDGRVLLSDEPTLVYNPFTGKIRKKEVLSEKQREYIYSTMG